MDFKYIDISSQPAWENIVKDSSSGGFMQSFFWSDFKRKTGWETFKIGVFQKDQMIGGAVIMKYRFSSDKNFLYIPEGPIFPYPQENIDKIFDGFMGEVDHIADLEGPCRTTHIRIEPREASLPDCFHRFKKAPYNLEPRDTLMLDLSFSEEKLLAQMKPKGRYNIKIADREGVEITMEDPSLKVVESFYNVYQETVKRDGFEGKDQRYFEILFEHLKDAKNAKVFFATAGKRVLATALIIFYGNRATYFFGASSNAERSKMAPYKLHWEIIRYAKKCGYYFYDFWGVIPEKADPSHKWHGLSKFKQKFGGKQYTFMGAYDFVYNQKLYFEFLKESGEID